MKRCNAMFSEYVQVQYSSLKSLCCSVGIRSYTTRYQEQGHEEALFWHWASMLVIGGLDEKAFRLPFCIAMCVCVCVSLLCCGFCWLLSAFSLSLILASLPCTVHVQQDHSPQAEQHTDATTQDLQPSLPVSGRDGLRLGGRQRRGELSRG